MAIFQYLGRWIFVSPRGGMGGGTVDRSESAFAAPYHFRSGNVRGAFR
jgi:hypothetical protein